MELEEHYGQLLGVETPWDISSIDLKIQDHRVDIVIEYTDDQGPCPECGTICPKHDDRKKRTWRHLDTMQFSTYLHCEVPRVRCETHGVKTVTIPWAAKNSRFTLLFEAFAITIYKQTRPDIKQCFQMFILRCKSLMINVTRLATRNFEWSSIRCHNLRIRSMILFKNSWGSLRLKSEREDWGKSMTMLWSGLT